MAQPASTPFSKTNLNLTPANAFWIGAGALVVLSLAGKPKLGLTLAAAAGALAFRTGKANALASNYTATAGFVVNASPQQAYQLWRNFAQLPRFMSHLKRVTILDDTRSEWVAVGPLDQEVSWQAEITHDAPNQLISWQSLPGAQIANSGSVTFRPDAQGRGTLVTAQITYELPLGPLAKALITSLGKNPEFVIKEDLRRFKSLLEAGEAPTTVGQAHGPRGVVGAVSSNLFRETTNHPEPQAKQTSQPEFQTA